MKHRQYFKGIIKENRYKGKKSCEDLNLVLTFLKRNERFVKSYLELELYDGIKWVEGYSNFINKTLLKETTNSENRRYKKGDIITVDFFGHFGEEMAYDHPAIVLRNFKNGVIVAPITSNKNLYNNPNEFHFSLPANDNKRGKMLKNSTIKFDQLRYISKKRILKSKQNKRISDNQILREIDILVMKLLGNYTFQSILEENKIENQELQKKIEKLKSKIQELESNKEISD